MFGSYIIFLAFIAVNGKSSLNHYHGHILKVNGEYEAVIGLANSFVERDDTMSEPVATGFFNQTYNVTGWSILEIQTSQNFSNIDQAYAAGLLEGRFTQGSRNYFCYFIMNIYIFS